MLRVVLKTKPCEKLFSSKSYQTKKVLAIIFIFAVTALAFSSKFGNRFVWDDHEFIEEDPAIRQLENIPSFFASSIVNLYRPLRTTLYALTYALSGMDPWGYHLVGWALHTVCAVLVFLLLAQWSQKLGLSLAAAALFAVHPVHTEAVTFITASFDLLGPLFFLLALFLYGKGGIGRTLSCLSYAMALLASEMAITLPLLLLATSVWLDREKVFAAARKLLPFWIIAGAYLTLRFGILAIGARDTLPLGGSIWSAFFTMTRVSVKYLRLLLFPFNLLADYRHFPILKHGADPSFLLSALFLVGATVFLFSKRKEWRWSWLGWVWFWILLLPVSNLIPIGIPMAERYLYLSSLALSLACLDFLPRFNIKKISILSGMILIFSGTTFFRNFAWKDDLTLWTQTALSAPASFVAHNNLGSAYMHAELYNSAYDEITEALKLKPDFVDAYTNLGALYEKRGMIEPARLAYENALALNPKHAASRCNLGNIYLKQGMTERGVAEYRRAVESDPYFYLAWYNLGNVCLKEGKWEEAESYYLKALEIQPRFEFAQHNLSIARAQKNATSSSYATPPQSERQ